MLHPTRLLYILLPMALCAGCDDDGSSDGGDAAVGGEGEGESDGEGDLSTAIAAAQGAAWGDNVTITVGADSFTFESDGVPSHGVLDAYALMDGTTTGVVATDTSYEIPLSPVLADAPTDTGLGTIGIAVSGGVFFNPYEGDGETVALDSNFEEDGAPFIDPCNGHPLPSGGSYHYHGIPHCITDVVDSEGEHSALIGYLLDGFPVYGPNGEGGAAPSDLDTCSSHTGVTPEFPEGIRHYHLTDTAPYSITCYVGEVTVSSDMGGPPGR